MLSTPSTSIIRLAARRTITSYALPASSSSARPLARSFTTNPPRFLAQPPSPSTSSASEEELNEAQRYLADKAARKAYRQQNPTSASARHASLYSQLFPALLRILAYGSTAYFGLHLLWNVLDRDEQTKLMEGQRKGLEATARSLAEKVDRATERVSAKAGEVVGKTEAKVEGESGKKKWYWPF